jgi:hypothetical protein
VSNALQIPAEPTFPGQGIIYDRAKMPVDTDGWTWTLNHAVSIVRLDFRKLQIPSPALLTAVVKYIAARLTTSSTDHVENTFDALCYLHRSSHFLECATNAEILLDDRLIADLKQVQSFAEYRLHYIRDWYRWCAKRDLPQFSRQVLERLEELKIGGNVKGRAVRTRDPEQGAFDKLELVALVSRLREIGPTVLTLFERTLLWLALALGSNPLAFALLREEDFTPTKEVGTKAVHHLLRVPRIKKRHPFFRAASHPKRLNEEIGRHVSELIRENASFRKKNDWPEGCAYPLFKRAQPRAALLDGPNHEFAMHCDPGDLTYALQRAIEKLAVVSHRTGQQLKANAMRFRRTFATRAVEENISPAELALSLDHTDLQNVQVYFETRSSIVDRLDAALAVELGPLADAFMGRIVANEDDAENGADPSKRIPWFRRSAGRPPEKAGNLGTCGSGPCSLFAPISCYTCRKFQPWKDGPHREILQWLCDERERNRAEGLDPQIVGIHDATILAIGEVVAACEQGDGSA